MLCGLPSIACATSCRKSSNVSHRLEPLILVERFVVDPAHDLAVVEADEVVGLDVAEDGSHFGSHQRLCAALPGCAIAERHVETRAAATISASASRASCEGDQACGAVRFLVAG